MSCMKLVECSNSINFTFAALIHRMVNPVVSKIKPLNKCDTIKIQPVERSKIM